MLFLSAATKLLIAPVVLLLVVVVGALALVIGNIIIYKRKQAHLSGLSSAEGRKPLKGQTALHTAAKLVFVFIELSINGTRSCTNIPQCCSTIGSAQLRKKEISA